jgi:hypothetical protein
MKFFVAMNISGFTENSIWRSVLVLKSPLAIQQHGFEVVIGAKPLVPRASVPHLQVDNGF